MASAAFIEPLPVIEFVAQLLPKDVLLRPLSDSDRVKVLFSILVMPIWFPFLGISFNLEYHFELFTRLRRPLEE